MNCCERLHTSANIAQQETTLLGPTMLRVVASVCTGLYNDPKKNLWKQCLCKILEGQTKSIMVFFILANIGANIHGFVG